MSGAGCCRGSRLRGWCSPGKSLPTGSTTPISRRKWRCASSLRANNVTRVELEHRRLDLYGARCDEMRGIFDSEMGWKGLLDAFAARASAE